MTAERVVCHSNATSSSASLIAGVSRMPTRWGRVTDFASRSRFAVRLVLVDLDLAILQLLERKGVEPSIYGLGKLADFISNDNGSAVRPVLIVS